MQYRPSIGQQERRGGERQFGGPKQPAIVIDGLQQQCVDVPVLDRTRTERTQKSFVGDSPRLRVRLFIRRCVRNVEPFLPILVDSQSPRQERYHHFTRTRYDGIIARQTPLPRCFRPVSFNHRRSCNNKQTSRDEVATLLDNSSECVAQDFTGTQTTLTGRWTERYFHLNSPVNRKPPSRIPIVMAALPQTAKVKGPFAIRTEVHDAFNEVRIVSIFADTGYKKSRLDVFEC